MKLTRLHRGYAYWDAETETLSLSKTTCQSGDEVAGFPSPWRQGHINWFPPCEARLFMGMQTFHNKNVLESQETYRNVWWTKPNVVSLHRGSRENHSSHKTFRPHTDMANSSVSHKWLHTKSQYLADNEGTKMGETRNRTGEYHDVGMLRARKYHIMKQQNPNISRW